MRCTVLVRIYEVRPVTVENIGEVVHSLQNLVFSIPGELHFALLVDGDAHGLWLAAPRLLPLINHERRKLDFESRARHSHLVDALDKSAVAFLSHPDR